MYNNENVGNHYYGNILSSKSSTIHNDINTKNTVNTLITIYNS